MITLNQIATGSYVPSNRKSFTSNMSLCDNQQELWDKTEKPTEGRSSNYTTLVAFPLWAAKILKNIALSAFLHQHRTFSKGCNIIFLHQHQTLFIKKTTSYCPSQMKQQLQHLNQLIFCLLGTIILSLADILKKYSTGHYQHLMWTWNF